MRIKIRIIGNSCSGKTTLSQKIGECFAIPTVHMAGIAFIPNSNFELRSNDVICEEISSLISINNKWIIEGDYFSILAEVYNVPDIIIVIDLPIE